jgi:hypothetical protein
VREALPLVGHLPRAVLAVQPGGGQESDVGQVDDHRPIGARGLRHRRGQRRATVGIDLAVDCDDRDRIPAPVLDDDVDGPAGFTATADTAVRARLREGEAVAGVVRVEAARYRCTGSPQGD